MLLFLYYGKIIDSCQIQLVYQWPLMFLQSRNQEIGMTFSERTLLTLQSVNNKLKSNTITRTLLTSLTSANYGAHFPRTLLPPITPVQEFVDERLQQLFGGQPLKSLKERRLSK